jgi:acetyl esterase
MAEAAGWRDWLAQLQAEGKLPTAGQTFETMRAALRRGLEVLEGPPPEIAEMRPMRLPGPAAAIEARLYTPLAAGIAPAGGLVFYHGGGFVLCDLDTHDRLCRRLAAAARVRILSTSYRLAPQHPFPAAYEDALAAFDWAAGEGADALGFDPARVGVGGDSAGGNLAAAVAQARRRPGTPERRAAVFQLLLYPLLQLAETGGRRMRVLEGHAISAAILDGVRANYLGPEGDPNDPRASPLFARDLAGVCPAFIMTAGLDPLHDEACVYADLLAAAGVAVASVHYGAVPHGFLQMTAMLDVALEAFDAAGEALAKGLEPA